MVFCQIEIVYAVAPSFYVPTDGCDQALDVDTLHLLQAQFEDLADTRTTIVVEGTLGEEGEHDLRETAAHQWNRRSYCKPLLVNCGQLVFSHLATPTLLALHIVWP